MENTEMRNGLCPNCGNELNIPAHLEKFACMYCGTVMTPKMLRQKAAAVSSDRPVNELLKEACDEFPRSLLDNPDLLKQFNKFDYKSSFENLCSTYRPVFEKFEVCFTAEGADKAEVINAGTDAFIAAVKADLDSKKSNSRTLDTYRTIIALYISPMIKSFGYSIGDAFALALCDKWIEAYPKFIYRVGTYEDLAAGFRKKFKLCFLTTAVCEHSGKPDDCYELQTLRAFRDGYLASSENGEELISEYYSIAPGIVTCIDVCGEGDTVYPMIREKYINPCIEDIENGRMESCRSRYITMVNELRNRYLPQ